ncbi:COP9 signalosome [Cunninghamella echinulata]|nr:COP9 signalosome [Cunninghamella echinulata]
MLLVYINNKDYNGLIQACEEYELQYEFLTESSISLTDIYAAYLGAYIIVDDLNSARFLRKRMLINQKNNGWIISDEANKIWEVCKALWNNDYQQAYGLLNNNGNNSSQQQQRWASVELQTMIVDILESIRERVLNKIVTAYTTISLVDVVYYFGLPENDLIQVLTSKGWIYEPSSQVFTIKKQDENKPHNTNFEQLTNIADTILQLEKF